MGTLTEKASFSGYNRTKRIMGKLILKLLIIIYNLNLQESSAAFQKKSDESERDPWESLKTAATSSNTDTSMTASSDSGASSMGTSLTSSDSRASNMGSSVTSSVTSTASGVSSDLKDNLAAMSVKDRIAAIKAKATGKPDSSVGKFHVVTNTYCCCSTQ